MKLSKFIIPICVALLLSACGENTKNTDNNYSQKSDSSELTEKIIDEKALNIKSNTDLLANDKNTAGNGYIIINDENDYPAYVKDIRFFNNDHSRTLDFWGKQISEGSILGYTDGISPYYDVNGNMGYVDIDGNVVIEPRFNNAYYFCNGTAEVSENGEVFCIDTNGKKVDNAKYQGYNGYMDNDSIYGIFTGTYLPFFSTLSTVIEPLQASTIAFTIDNPKPDPPISRDRDLSTR